MADSYYIMGEPFVASPPAIKRESAPRSNLGVALGALEVGHAIMVSVNSMQGARSAVSSAIARAKAADGSKEFTTRTEADGYHPNITIYRTA